jgi:hypothetical protein
MVLEMQRYCVPVYLPGEMILIKAEAYARAATPDLANGFLN